jgi:mono/diheme cytochrome c family protein
MKRLILIGVMVAASPAAVADAARGKTLHDEQCTKCHGTDVYTRSDHFIKNREALAKQVQRCQLSAGAQWFDEDVNDVVEYLNATFYKFE